MNSIVRSVAHWGSHSKSPVSPKDLCETCGKKSKFVENGVQHPYCSRSCARTGQGGSPSACALRGCRATGKTAFSGFCSEIHARDGVRAGLVKGCTQCGTLPESIDGLCISCDRSLRAATRFRELDSHGTTFRSVVSHFENAWQSTKSEVPVTVEKVYEIILPRDVSVRHELYQKSLALAGTFRDVRTFYGSQCICNLGTKEAVLCKWQSCGICSAVKSSFKMLACSRAQDIGRYGEGIYSYHNPALADHFATSCISSPFRIVIACDVSVATRREQSPSSPMLSTESVDDGERVFISNVDGIIPAYVIIYK